MKMLLFVSLISFPENAGGNNDRRRAEATLPRLQQGVDIARRVRKACEEARTTGWICVQLLRCSVLSRGGTETAFKGQPRSLQVQPMRGRRSQVQQQGGAGCAR